MPLRVGPLRVPAGEDDVDLAARALARAGLSADEVASIELVRQSVDRRRGRRPEIVSSFDLHLKDGARPRQRRRDDPLVRFVEIDVPAAPVPGDRDLPHRPVVIGAGPGGLFAALVLARAGYRPLVLERGARMNARVRDIESFHRRSALSPESNYLFGEGGAGTFSDGKLTSRSKDPRARLVLEEFRLKSGMEVVRYWYRPHLGSDRVRAVVGRLRREIEELGGEIRYLTRVEEPVIDRGRLRGLLVDGLQVPATAVICAPGHSARDFYRALLRCGVALERKPFQMGFRIEHPQGVVDRWVLGELATHPTLAPADYRLVADVMPRGVYSFCMCPGGEIIPAVHDTRHYNTNGMSWYRKDSGFANSGFVTTVEPAEFDGEGVLAGIELQERFELIAAEAAGDRFELPAQRLADFVAGRPSDDVPPTSCRTGARPADVRALAPAWITQALIDALAVFDRRYPGFVGDDALICGPEARSSAPVRLPRDPETLEAVGVDGFYPVGEGAGHAGGIVSAAVDGWRAAEALIRRFSLPSATN